MKIYIHRTTGIATANIGDTMPIQTLQAILGATLFLDCVFIDDNGNPVELDPTAAGAFVAKQDEHYDSAALVDALSWVKASAPENGYRFTILPNDSTLTTQLANLDAIILMAQIEWTEPGFIGKTQKISLNVTNAIYRGNELTLTNPTATWPLPGDLVTQAALATALASLVTQNALTAALAGLSSGGGVVDYELKSADFAAVAGRAYSVDTTAGPVAVTLPTAPVGGSPIAFADARGTWNSHAVTFSSGGKIEGQMISYEDAAQGTSLVMVYIDATTGWRILEAGTKPHNLTVPILAGNSVGTAITATPGLWTGSPYSYLYQWQTSSDGTTWTDISGATAATYTPVTGDLTHFVRVEVTAINSNGSSLPALSAASAAITAPVFPAGAIGAWHLTADGTDATGNGLDLTNYNGVTFDPTTGATFDGTNNLESPSLATQLAGSSFTLAFNAKFNFAELTHSDAGLVDSWLGGGAYNLRITTSDQKVGAWFNAGSETKASAPTDNAFHNYVLRFNHSTGAYDLWIDGVQVLNGTGGSTGSWSNGLVWGSAYFLIGSIKETTLWNRFISTAEIAVIAGGALYA